MSLGLLLFYPQQLNSLHRCNNGCASAVSQVFMLPSDAVLNEETLVRILESGHSRVPVHKPGER